MAVFYQIQWLVFSGLLLKAIDVCELAGYFPSGSTILMNAAPNPSISTQSWTTDILIVGYL